MIKKIISIGVLTVMAVSLFACDNAPDPITTEDYTTKEPSVTNPVQTEAPADTEDDEKAVYYEPIKREPFTRSDFKTENTDWSSTISTADSFANAITGSYTDSGRSGFTFANKNARYTHNLTSAGKMYVSSVTNLKGGAYISNTSDAFIKDSEGTKYLASASYTDTRMNSSRLGFYFYDFHFLGQDFVNPAPVNQSQIEYDILNASNGSWTGNDVSNIKYDKESKVLNFEIKATTDPYVLTRNISYDAKTYNAVKIRVKTEKSATITFYIIAGAQNEFNGSQFITFNVTPGVEKEYTIALEALSDYTGSVRGFRIDTGSSAGEKISVYSVKACSTDNISVPVKFERTYYTFSDMVHEELRFLATSDTEGLTEYGSTTVIPANTVSKLIIKDKNGEKNKLDGIDRDSIEYVAFDVKNVGVYGIIMPVRKDNGFLRVTLENGNYVITRVYESQRVLFTGKSYIIGHRIYTDDTHSFNPFRKAAYIERNPLKDVTVLSEGDKASYIGYNPLTGAYEFSISSIDFSTAYYKTPDKQFKIYAGFSGDGVTDRTVYIKTVSTEEGSIEGGALLDENNSLLPVAIEVCKNFEGEIEEPLFDPQDKKYSETYFPITLQANELKNFTVLNLYQKWGKVPLKQLSSIAFHISYYHLSVGVTETNCIAPYFVYGKDAWTLPDFRALSSPLWPGQPQHTSAGRLYFLKYTDSDGKEQKSESQNAVIDSSGPVYADINMDYLSDDGKITAEYRHMELPQTDETRTYYQIKLTVNDDVNISDFARDFSFFSFDGRSVLYRQLGYLDENGEMQIKKATDSKSYTEYIKLGKQNPYYDYFDAGGGDTVNFALIVKNSDITIGGQKYNGNFILKNTFDGNLNTGALTLDLKQVTLKKGDVISINLILLPWGSTASKNDNNVRGVREDSCLNPYKLTAVKGEVIKDAYLPKITAENNEARFVLSGGKNNAVVRVYGLKSYKKPTLIEVINGEETEYTVQSKNRYDGYQVYAEADGTYSVSFAISMGEDGAAREFIVRGQ